MLMKFLDDLSLSKKLIMVMICLLAPSVLLLKQTITAHYRLISALDFELKGIRYVSAASKAPVSVADHRGTSYLYLGGDKSLASELSRSITVVEANLAAVDALQREADSAWRSTDEWKQALEAWRTIRNKEADPTFTANETVTLHTQVITNLEALGKRAIDNSKLSLDSDETSHGLIDAAILRLPHAQTEMFDLRRRAVGAAQRVRTASAPTAAAIAPQNRPKPADTSGGPPNAVPPTGLTIATRVGVGSSAALVRESSNSLIQIVNLLIKRDPALEPKLRSPIDSYVASAKTFADLSNDQLAVIESPNVEVGAVFAAAAKAYNDAGALQDALIAVLDERLLSRVHAEVFQRNLILAVYFLVLSSVLLIEHRLRRRITGNAKYLVSTIGAMASGKIGNKSIKPGGDEFSRITDAVSRLDAKLVQVIVAIRATTDSVNSAAHELSQGNDDLSSRTQEQASVLEETASSMEEMTATVKQNADSAHEANKLAASAREQAERGAIVVDRAIEAMGQINRSSKQIADIISVIDGISFQTNLLALNAAVEAARAGEQGRGFAVVATEVRNLAQRSATAAQEIKLLINESAKRVQAGSELVNDSGRTLVEILDSVKRVTDFVAAIAAASREQSSGIDQVNNAVTQMDSATQHNAALVEQSSAASKAILGTVDRLVAEIAYFRLESRDIVELHGTAATRTPLNSIDMQAANEPPDETELDAAPSHYGKAASG